MKRALPLLATLALAACATMPAASLSPTAGLGRDAGVGNLRVRPVQIVEDSRCPVNVQCVWAGRLVILAEVDFRGGSETFRGNLTLGKILRYGSESVTLVGALPDKVAGSPTNPRDYRFTFRSGTD